MSKAQLFGKMLDRGVGKINHYRSDLYHDAQYIEKYQGKFTWVVGDCGTHIFPISGELMGEEVQTPFEDMKGYLNSVGYPTKDVYIVDTKEETITEVDSQLEILKNHY